MLLALFIVASPLGVSVVIDPARPPLTQHQVERILKNAESAYAHRLEKADTELVVRQTGSLADYFDALPKAGLDDCLKRFLGNRIERLSDYDSPPLLAKVTGFVTRWPLAALQRAFPTPIRSYDSAARMLIDRMRHDAEPAFAGGGALSSLLYGHRFSDWACALELQQNDDIVITNAFVFYDLAAEPYPHTVFHGTRLSGAAMLSPERDPLFGRAIFISTYGEPQPSDEFVGTFLLAHELGHAILKIPDVYDHGPGCLMNTSFAPSYEGAYAALLHRSGYCSKCRVYRQAHAYVRRLDATLARGEMNKAEQALDRALHLLPSVVDGDAAAYKSRLLLHLAEPELQAGRLKKAEAYAHRALVLDTGNDKARLLLRRVRARLQLPESR